MPPRPRPRPPYRPVAALWLWSWLVASLAYLAWALRFATTAPAPLAARPRSIPVASEARPAEPPDSPNAPVLVAATRSRSPAVEDGSVVSLPPPPPPPPPSGPPSDSDPSPPFETVDDPVEREAMKAAIRGELPAMARCFDEQHVERGGRVMLEFTIINRAGRAHLESAEIVEGSLPNLLVEQCLLLAAAHAAFPAPHARRIKLRHPLRFEAE